MKLAAIVLTQPESSVCLKGWNYFKTDFWYDTGRGAGGSHPNLVGKDAVLGGCFFTECVTLKCISHLCVDGLCATRFFPVALWLLYDLGIQERPSRQRKSRKLIFPAAWEALVLLFTFRCASLAAGHVSNWVFPKLHHPETHLDSLVCCGSPLLVCQAVAGRAGTSVSLPTREPCVRASGGTEWVCLVEGWIILLEQKMLLED